MLKIKFKRGTRSQLNTAASSNQLEQGEPYLITDENRIAIGLTASTYQDVNKAMVGLTNVDNTSDANKPVSTAQQTALNLKANIASPTFTGTVGGITKAMVGLTNVDNTSDATKNSATATLTNKRITKRVTTEASSATPTINTNNCDIHKITALAVNITNMSTNLSGTPTDGQMLLIQITGTAARTISWGTSFESSTVTLPSTTVTTARLDVGFIWNAATSKWRCIATA
jgi:hypothetical protein